MKGRGSDVYKMLRDIDEAIAGITEWLHVLTWSEKKIEKYLSGPGKSQGNL